jgi:hypothetical protein
LPVGEKKSKPEPTTSFVPRIFSSFAQNASYSRPSDVPNLFGAQAPYCNMNAEIGRKIFRLFDGTQLKSAKLVNKKWYEMVQEVEKTNVVVHHN